MFDRCATFLFLLLLPEFVSLTYSVVRFKVENFSQIKDSVFSEPCSIRNLPWKINITQERNTKFVGYFLQCNGESESSAWFCHANADLRLINQRDGVKFSRKIQHLFYSKENNWGFSHYMGWNDVQDLDKGYIKTTA